MNSKFVLFLCFLALSSSLLQAQLEAPKNMTLLANANDYPLNGSLSYNDIWGYVDSKGIEYAVIGAHSATIIYDISTPTAPREVAYIPGTNSIWRDIKSFGDYLYVVADQGTDGLLMINMAQAPDSISWSFWQPSLTVGEQSNVLNKCHNLYIDAQGIAYLSGCNIANGGVLMIDVGTNPGTPEFIGAATQRYSHDNFSRGDTLWSADVFAGFFSVIDVSDKNNPKLLATQETTSKFTHNCWLSDDGKYLFTTDERPNGRVDAYDVSDLGNIQLLDTYVPAATAGTGVYPHNVHFANNFLVISYYTDGVKIVDAHRPDNLIETASFDTWPRAGGGTDGCWGAYPFLPSGLILASDLETGLYILEADFIQACYLEGTVKAAGTGILIPGAAIEILNTSPNQAISNGFGVFKTGLAEAGQYEVVIRKEGYLSKTVTVDLQNGQLTELNVELQAANNYQINGSVIAGNGGAGIPGLVMLKNQEVTYEVLADSNGLFTIPSVIEGVYDIYAGSWGYRQVFLESQTIDAGNTSLTFELETGYEDDFILDLGWSANGSTARSGLWERGIPIGTFFDGTLVNIDRDVEDDLGAYCYVTGNGGENSGFDDVDNGLVRLSSPAFDLTGYENPVLQFSTWFYNGGGNSAPDDTLRIILSNGITTITLENITENPASWQAHEYVLKDLLPLTSNMQLILETSDLPETPHLVEAGLDRFRIEDRLSTANHALSQLEGTLLPAPNPFGAACRLEYRFHPAQGPFQLEVYNTAGQLIEQSQLNGHQGMVWLGQNWKNGLFLLRVTAADGARQSIRLLKNR